MVNSSPVQQFFPWWFFPELPGVLEHRHFPGQLWELLENSSSRLLQVPRSGFVTKGSYLSAEWTQVKSRPGGWGTISSSSAIVINISDVGVCHRLLFSPVNLIPNLHFPLLPLGKKPSKYFISTPNGFFFGSLKELKAAFCLPPPKVFFWFCLSWKRTDYSFACFGTGVGQGHFLPSLTIQFHSLYSLIYLHVFYALLKKTMFLMLQEHDDLGII